MNSLSAKSTNSLIALVSAWKEMHDAVIAAADGTVQSPVQINGLRGSLPGFFVSQFMDRTVLNAIHDQQYSGGGKADVRDMYIVVSTQKEADECESDLQTITESKFEIHKLPWWGTLPSVYL